MFAPSAQTQQLVRTQPQQDLEALRRERAEFWVKNRERHPLRAHLPRQWRTAEAIAEFYRMFGSRQDVERDLERIQKELAEGEWETDPTLVSCRDKLAADHQQQADSLWRKRHEWEETTRAADDARRAYIGVLRQTIALYEENLVHSHPSRPYAVFEADGSTALRRACTAGSSALSANTRSVSPGASTVPPLGMRNSPSRLRRTMSAPEGRPTSTMRFPTTAPSWDSAISTKSLFMRSTGSKSRG
jgi:hypothetical protein